MSNALCSSKLDITLMKFCVILCPWIVVIFYWVDLGQYDRYIVHDERLNQYTLCVNGRKQILLPLIESRDEVNCTTCENLHG